MIPKLTITIMLGFSVLWSYGQQPGLYFHENVFHSNSLNPASLMDEYVVSLGLPFTALQYYSQEAAPRDFMSREDGKEFMDLSNFSNNPGEYIFEARAQVGALDLMVDLNDWYFFIRQTLHSSSWYTSDRQFIQLMWDGPGSLDNGSYQFSVASDEVLYNELSYGTGMDFGNFRIGGRINTIFGLSNVSTSGTGFDVQITNGAIQGDVDFTVHSANMDEHGYDIFNPYENVIFSFDYFTENRGRSFDLGASVDLFKDWKVSASVIGWKGEINWKHDIENYVARPNLNIENWTFDDVMQDYSSSVDFKVQKAKQVFRTTKNEETYKTRLPYYTYIGVSYDYKEQWRFGMLWHQANYPAYKVNGVSAQAIYSLTDYVHFGGSYNHLGDGRPDQLGVSIVAQYKSLQVFLVNDNLFTTFAPKEHTNGGGRAGLALALD